MTPPLGAHCSPHGINFAVRAPRALGVDLCLFEGTTEHRLPMARNGDAWVLEVPGLPRGQPYGYRAHGRFAPDEGHWFDPAKLLVDPYAQRLDRRFVHDPQLSRFGEDTAALVPRALVPSPLAPVPSAGPRFQPGGLIYELNVRSFTMRHPTIPLPQRGTIAALAHPAILDHLRRLHVSAVELMPIVAWIDERHLPPLGLSNAWGYNPVAPMALDPGLGPGGLAELRATVAALHDAGIGVILDIVLNHTGESDRLGPTLCLRGLDPAAYASVADGTLLNDTGCGNQLDFAQPQVRRLALDTLRHFVLAAGIDGFRFDLATVLARGPGFDPDAPFFADIAADAVLADRVLIAEPWDVGPGGYQLGHFPRPWLEWNDRYRDDVRRFWRGEAAPGSLGTRLAGSSDLFGNHPRGVSYIASHDGFSLADVVAFAERHNEANGEAGQDGQHENHSWNNGIEGATEDAEVIARRANDLRALLTTLFATTGTIQLTAGDEFGRTQHGNNNAYAQDGSDFWLDWASRDTRLEALAYMLAEMRARAHDLFRRLPPDVTWLRLDGLPMAPADWEDPAAPGFQLMARDGPHGYRLTIDRAARTARLHVEPSQLGAPICAA